jgi:hypothetical protein
MSKKKRAPIEQLRASAKVANDMLADRGIITRDSTIARILTETTTILPGEIPYLPMRWSIEGARRIVANCGYIWLNENKGTMRAEDSKAFFEHIGKIMKEEIKKVKTEVDATPALIKHLKTTNKSVSLYKLFDPMNRLETTEAMWAFIYDSFAVSVIVKQHTCVSEFLIWFDEWTQELEALWSRKNKGV